MKTTGLQRSMLAGVAGFIVYGGWAYFINASHGFETGLRSGLVQGGYSLLLTLSTTLMMEYLMDFFSHMKGQIILTILATSIVTFGTAYGIHWLFRTPEILMTITPGFIVGLVYTTVYVTTLNRLRILQETD